MSIHPYHAGILLTVALIQGCATQSAPNKSNETPSAASKPAETNAQAKDNVGTGKIIGTPAKNSKFAKIQLGLTYRQVTELIGEPDNMLRHETGKRWIPYYFGSDVQRLQVFYKNEGCLTYTGGNVFGGGTNELIRIISDPKGECWKP